jgi:hypothetical protein
MDVAAQLVSAEEKWNPVWRERARRGQSEGAKLSDGIVRGHNVGGNGER